MTVENYLAETAALAGLAGIMAGFSLAAVIQLLTAASAGKLMTAGIVVFSAASVMFLFELIVAVLSLAAAELARVGRDHGRLDTFQNCRYYHNGLCPGLHLLNYICHLLRAGTLYVNAA